MERSKGCMEKLDRMLKTLHHEEADRVRRVSDFYWGGFLSRWKEELGLPADTDIYDYYDLDWQCTTPNMDPHIKNFEIVKQDDEEVVVRTGYEAVIRKKFEDPMPAFLSFSIDEIEQLDDFQFDDPWDDRRYFSGGRQPDRRGRRRIHTRHTAMDRHRESDLSQTPRVAAASAKDTSSFGASSARRERDDVDRTLSR